MKHADRLLPALSAMAAGALVVLAALAGPSAGEQSPIRLAPGGHAPVLAAPAAAAMGRVFFENVDITIDTQVPLAAYQLEVRPVTTAGITARIVGIEGGDTAPFIDPPYYDPAALAGDRVILAAYSTAEQLPKGRFRIARVHVQVTIDAPEPKPGDDAAPKVSVRPNPAYTVSLSTAAGAIAQPITPAPTATITIGASK